MKRIDASESATIAVAEGVAEPDEFARLRQAVSTLRDWADDARRTSVTQGNAVQVLDVTVDRLGVFFDRFADLIEGQYPHPHG